MFCTSCGQSTNEGTEICPNCGAHVVFPPAAVQMPSINNYLIPSILVTLCCCMPFGVVAIIYAAQVSTKLAAGDLEGAQTASNNAKLWCWLGFGFGLLFLIGYGLLTGFAALGKH